MRNLVILFILGLTFNSCKSTFNATKNQNELVGHVQKSFPNTLIYKEKNINNYLVLIDTTENKIYTLKYKYLFSNKVSEIVLLEKF